MRISSLSRSTRVRASVTETRIVSDCCADPTVNGDRSNATANSLPEIIEEVTQSWCDSFDGGAGFRHEGPWTCRACKLLGEWEFRYPDIGHRRSEIGHRTAIRATFHPVPGGSGPTSGTAGHKQILR